MDVEVMSEATENENSEPKTLNIPSDEKLVINIGGCKFETKRSTLLRIPGTRLALLAKLGQGDESYDEENNEYFFDRHSMVFHSILNFYRSGELHFDADICGNIMQQELTFWGIYESEVESCCWERYSEQLDIRECLSTFDTVFEEPDPPDYEERMSWKAKLWAILDNPGSSRGGKMFLLISMVFTGCSIALFMMESHHGFRVVYNSETTYIPAPPPPDTSCCHNKDNTTAVHSHPHPYLTYVDYALLAYFFLEFCLLFYAAPRKIVFLKKFTNIIDLVCVIAQLSSLIQNLTDPGSEEYQTISRMIIVSLRSLRVVRVLRIFKILKHYTGFKVLVYTIKVSTKELLLIIAFLMTGVMLFASIIYFTEPQTFPSIPYGFWWALVTMSTVGYGDAYPKTNLGYVVGSLCVICGLLTVAFTVPIVVKNFTLYYGHAQSRLKDPLRKKKQNRILVSVASESSTFETSFNGSVSTEENPSVTSVKSIARNGLKKSKYITSKTSYIMEAQALAEKAKYLNDQKKRERQRQMACMALNRLRKGSGRKSIILPSKRILVSPTPKVVLSPMPSSSSNGKNQFIDYANISNK